MSIKGTGITLQDNWDRYISFSATCPQCEDRVDVCMGSVKDKDTCDCGLTWRLKISVEGDKEDE